MEWTPALILSLVLGAVIGYLLGSLNFSIIISKVMMHDDVRNHGSGNAGLTNALRTMGKGPAVLTLIGDFFKGIIAILLSRLIYKYLGGVPSDAMFLLGDYIPAFFALLGHVFPLYYKFKGGKGILVSFGALMVMSPAAGLVAFTSFLLFVIFTKYVSLGSISAAVVLPFAVLLCRYIQFGELFWWEALYSLPFAFLTLYKHKDNMKRLIKGEENKLSFKKK